MQTNIPEKIGGADLLYFIVLGNIHIPTGKTIHTVAGKIRNDFKGLAICKYENDPGIYLFYCDDKWNVITDTFHESVEHAKNQGEFEFMNSINTWVEFNP